MATKKSCEGGEFCKTCRRDKEEMATKKNRQALDEALAAALARVTKLFEAAMDRRDRHRLERNRLAKKHARLSKALMVVDEQVLRRERLIMETHGRVQALSEARAILLERTSINQKEK